MRILKVDSRKSTRLFHRVPHHIYHIYPHYIFPMEQEIENIFSPKHNTLLTKNEACRWILYDKAGKPLGRIAAFTHYTDKPEDKRLLGGMGFFECVENDTYAHQLFNIAGQWLTNRGVNKIYAPINFGPRYQYWGLLTHNFQLSPYFGQNYHPPYYKSFFESSRFKKAYDQYIFAVSANDILPEIYQARAERIFNNPAYKFVQFSWQNKLAFLEDFVSVYNLAWQHQEGFEELSLNRCLQLFNKLKGFIDTSFIWIAYFRNQPIGCFLGIPDINERLVQLKGKMHVFYMLQLALTFTPFPYKRVIGLIFGLTPAFQRKGIEGAFFSLISKELHRLSYQQMLISWIGEFNPSMKRIIEVLGANHIQTMTTYQFDLDSITPNY